MKVWLKFLAGSVLGVVLGFLLPQTSESVREVLSWSAELAVRIGRYSLVPMLFFSLAVSVFELRQDGKFLSLALKTAAAIVGAALLMVLLGLIIVSLFPPARIPILIEGQKESISLQVKSVLLDIFPSNSFSSLISDGSFLTPLLLFAVFLGAGLSSARSWTKNVAALTDALARLFYHIAAFFTEILGLGMIALAAFWAVQYRDALQAGVFNELMILLAVSALVLAAGILPLFLFIAGKNTNPWKQLYGSIAPAMAAFFSGDLHFSLPVMIRHAKENHGVKRRANTFVLSLFATFGRAGSAMVAAIAFVVIIKSYSSLGISLADVMTIFGWSICISFLLPRYPGIGAWSALAMLCGLYGRGFEAGYLILKPVAFYLIAIGSFLDVLLMSLATWIIAKMEGYAERKDIAHFI